jgi:hypothetical protein
MLLLLLPLPVLMLVCCDVAIEPHRLAFVVARVGLSMLLLLPLLLLLLPPPLLLLVLMF